MIDQPIEDPVNHRCSSEGTLTDLTRQRVTLALANAAKQGSVHGLREIRAHCSTRVGPIRRNRKLWRLSVRYHCCNAVVVLDGVQRDPLLIVLRTLANQWAAQRASQRETLRRRG
jgi:hypothetical protein